MLRVILASNIHNWEERAKFQASKTPQSKQQNQLLTELEPEREAFDARYKARASWQRANQNSHHLDSSMVNKTSIENLKHTQVRCGWASQCNQYLRGSARKIMSSRPPWATHWHCVLYRASCLKTGPSFSKEKKINTCFDRLHFSKHNGRRAIFAACIPFFHYLVYM